MNRIKIAIVAFVAISSVSVGTVLANQDAGARLGQWYSNVYQKSSDSIIQENEKELPRLNEATNEFLKVSQTNADSQIRSTLLNTLNQSKSNIQNHQLSYQSRLNKAKAEIEKSNFGDFTEIDQTKLNSEITDDVEDMLSEVLGE